MRESGVSNIKREDKFGDFQRSMGGYCIYNAEVDNGRLEFHFSKRGMIIIRKIPIKQRENKLNYGRRRRRRRFSLHDFKFYFSERKCYSLERRHKQMFSLYYFFSFFLTAFSSSSEGSYEMST